MNQKYIVSIGYTRLAFDDKNVAMQVYSLLTESTSVDTVYVSDRPEALKNIEFVRETSSIEIELKRYDSSKFALHWTAEEFKEKCKPQPTEVDGDARLIEDQNVPAIAAPSNDDDIVDAEFI